MPPTEILDRIFIRSFSERFLPLVVVYASLLRALRPAAPPASPAAPARGMIRRVLVQRPCFFIYTMYLQPTGLRVPAFAASSPGHHEPTMLPKNEGHGHTADNMAATHLPPAGPPEAHAEVLCRRRQRYKNASVLERPPQGYSHRLKLAEGTSLRGLTCHCTNKAGYIYSSSLQICQVALLLLRERRSAGLGELERARGRSKYYRARPHQACFARRPNLER
jgi:hypothetical protein